MQQATRAQDNRNNRQFWPLLDRTQPDPSLNAEDALAVPRAGQCCRREPRDAKGWQRPLGWLRRVGQFFFALSFSSLTRRIVSLNLAGLIALVASILYLSQFRAGLIDARAQSLLVQAEIIAGAIAASATVDTNTITIDPDRLHDLKPGETYGAPDEYSGLDFPINPERVAPVLRTADFADQDPRPYFRPRRRPDPRQPQSLRPRRRAALRTAAAVGRRSRASPNAR